MSRGQGEEDIISVFRVPCINENNICVERGLYISNSYFKPKHMYRYIRVARGID